jgi:hypothetical protein
MDLRLPVGSMTQSPLVQHSPRELLGNATCFFERILPRAAQRHDLGPMHEAQAFVRHHLRLLLAPARERHRPLPRPPKLEDVSTERDHVAVDDRSPRA